MKAWGLYVIGLFVVTLSLSNTKGTGYDVKYSDSVQRQAVISVNKIDKLNEEAKNNMLDTLLDIRDSNSDTIVEIQYIETATIDTIEVHHNIQVPIYCEVVRSIYSSRGAHVECDTCPCTNYKH